MDVLDDGDLLDYLCIIKALIINADKRKNDSKLNGERNLDSYLCNVDSCEKKLLYGTDFSSAENTEIVKNVILESIKYFGDTVFKIMDQSSWGALVPNPLLIRNVTGEIDLGGQVSEFRSASKSTPGDESTNLSSFLVRGQTYLKDGKKIPSPKPLFHGRGMQVVTRGSFSAHVALEKWCAFPKHEQSNEWLILNYMVPGSSCVHVVCLFTASKEALKVIRDMDSSRTASTTTTTPSSSSSVLPPTLAAKASSSTTTATATATTASSSNRAWMKLLRRFWTAEKSFCDNRFKMIPQIIQGNWAIQMAVGSKPALTGKKIVQTYTRGKGYLEIDIDISASSMATGILAMVRGVSKHLVVDIGVTIQGEEEDELPEVIICQNRFQNVDLDAGELIP